MYLANSVLIPLGLTAVASVAHAGIHLKILWSETETLIKSNDEMKDIKIVKSLKDWGLLLKGARETIPNKAKQQKGGFLSMLLVTLGASLSDNIFAGKGMNRAGEGFLRAGYGSLIKKTLTNFEIQKYYQNEPRFMVTILKIIYQIK